MPRGDRTGPAGMGPMSGRGAGFCAGYGVPGYMNPLPGAGAWGRGMGMRGGGRGRGYRNMYWATGLLGWQRAAMGFPGAYPYGGPAPFYEPSAEQELTALRSQVKFMEEGLRETQERIKELEQEQSAQDKK
jgi:hypothetical protein